MTANYIKSVMELKYTECSESSWISKLTCLSVHYSFNIQDKSERSGKGTSDTLKGGQFRWGCF